MRVLACILNWRTADMTLRSLASLAPELRAIPGARVCVVDNDSQDGSYERLVAGVQAAGFGDIAEVVASGRNGGYGFGNNVAIRSGLAAADKPDYFYLLNSDAFAEEGALRHLVAYLDAHPAVGAAGGYVQGVDHQPHTAAFRFPSLLSEFEDAVRLGVVTHVLRDHRVSMPPPEGDVDDIDWVPGSSMLLRRQALEQVGLFDETFFLYFEETDLCRRMKGAGWKIAFVRASRVEHVEGGSTGVNVKQNHLRRTPTYLFDSRRWYLLKHHGRGYLWACNAARALGLASWRVRRRILNRPEDDFQRGLQDFLVHWAKNP
jgi:GT2 family glycosyltransferase